MCLVRMDIERVVSPIVEAMLPRFSDDKTVLVMSFDLHMRRKNDYGGSIIHRKVHLMFHRPDNYTKVLWNVSDEWNYREHTVCVWQLKSNHDSCWRTDGIESPFFQLAQEMIEEVQPRVKDSLM